MESFILKYPFFKPDKDGLVLINNLVGGEFVNEGYIIGDYFIPYSPYFGFTSGRNYGYFNFELLGKINSDKFLKYSGVKLSILFDYESIIRKEFFRGGDLGGAGRGIPKFNVNKLLSLKEDNLSEKHRRNPYFNEVHGNKIIRTEFFYQASDKSLHIEEITNSVIKNLIVNRFFHTIFEDNNYVNHFDGTLLFYEYEDSKIRLNTSLDKKIKNESRYLKLFRVDGLIDITNWTEVALAWFCRNELVEEWLDYDLYIKEYKDILKHNIDY